MAAKSTEKNSEKAAAAAPDSKAAANRERALESAISDIPRPTATVRSCASATPARR